MKKAHLWDSKQQAYRNQMSNFMSGEDYDPKDEVTPATDPTGLNKTVQGRLEQDLDPER